MYKQILTEGAEAIEKALERIGEKISKRYSKVKLADA